MASVLAEPITCDLIGLNIKEIYDLAIFSLDEDLRCRTLQVGRDQLRSIYESVGLNAKEDDSIRNFNIIMLYLYMCGKTHYKLNERGVVPWKNSVQSITGGPEPSHEDMLERFMKVVEIPKCLDRCLVYMFEAFLGTANTAVKRGMLTVLWGSLQSLLLREDYREITPAIREENLKSRKLRVSITRGMFFNVLDVHRILYYHKFDKYKEDIKMCLKGSETRLKKLAEINAPRMFNLDVISDTGHALYKAIVQ